MWAATATFEAQFDLRRGCGGSPPPPATGAQHGWCGAGSALDGDACGPAYEDGDVFLTRSCADRADSGAALLLQHDSALCAWTTPPAQQYKYYTVKVDLYGSEFVFAIFMLPSVQYK